MNRTFLISLGTAILLANSATVFAQHDHAAHGTAAMAPKPAVVEMSTGEVKKLDAQKLIVTLAHGPINNLNMPPMTMSFKLKSASVLGKVKVGDKVRFIAEAGADMPMVTVLEITK